MGFFDTLVVDEQHKYKNDKYILIIYVVIRQNDIENIFTIFDMYEIFNFCHRRFEIFFYLPKYKIT